MKTFLSLTVILFAYLSILPTPAVTDGCFVWRNEAIDIHEPEQKALIFFHDGYEDLILSVKFEGAPKEFGWIVPLPSVPEMSAENILLFEHLSKATQERQYQRSERGRRLFSHLGSSGVEVVKEQTVGIYDATIVRSLDGLAFEEWLRVNDFRLPNAADKVLDRYARKGWVFAALKIRPDEADSLRTGELTSGTIQPVRFSFECIEPVFPLEISSLNPGESQILIYVLSRGIVVPRHSRNSSWQSQIYSRGGEHHWIEQYQYTTKMGGFLPDYDYEELFYLTKHRARFVASDMEDVYFEPYDPSVGLSSPDSTVRIEAVTHLGLQKIPGAQQLLLHALSKNPRGPELCCILWALGQAGGKETERVLIEYLDDSDPEVRLEAIEALAQLESMEPLLHLIRSLEEHQPVTDIHTKYAEDGVRRAYFDYLVKAGDKTCIRGLRDLARTHKGEKWWSERAMTHGKYDSSEQLLDPCVLAVAALAACGDSRARRRITEAIVLRGAVTQHEYLESAVRSRCSWENTLEGLWIGHTIFSKRTVEGPWQSLRWVHDLFSANTEFRDGLYRECSLDERLPTAGVIVLMAKLEALGEGELEQLRKFWKNSIREPVLTIDALNLDDVRWRKDWQRDVNDIPKIRYNYNACSVAYTLARHNCVEELLRLWDTVPENDPVLQGEVVLAMAKANDCRYYPLVRDYVRNVWGHRASLPEFEEELRMRLDSAKTVRERLFAFYFAPFDLVYRMNAIRKFLFGYQQDPNFARELIMNRDLPPYLRLFILRQPNYYSKDFKPLLPVARTELAFLIEEHGDNLLIRSLAKTTEETFERMARRQDQRSRGQYVRKGFSGTGH